MNVNKMCLQNTNTLYEAKSKGGHIVQFQGQGHKVKIKVEIERSCHKEHMWNMKAQSLNIYKILLDEFQIFCRDQWMDGQTAPKLYATDLSI
jgi:hypothetical protein